MGEGAATSARWMLDNVLASDKVLYRGHPVAAVAATDAHIAEDALDLIEVEYEVLEPVLDVIEAMDDNAPVLHEILRTQEVAGMFDPPGGLGDKQTNIAKHAMFEAGDVDAGFAEADVIVEREFRTSMAHQGYIEPHNGSAFYNRDGHLTVWTSTQGSFGIRDMIATLMDMPISSVTCVPMEIGGGFGGKIPVYLEPLAAMMSKQTGRPVKLVMTRQAVLEATGPTSGTVVRAKIGAKNDGTITAASVWLAFEAGGYPGSPFTAGAMCALGPYEIENAVVEGFDVVVNKPKVSAYRAPGAPQTEFAVESVIDELAERLEMDPMDLRQKNAATEGTRRVDGAVFGVIGNEEVMDVVKNSDHYRSELQGENRGRGVAIGFWFNVGFESSAYANVNSDGTVSLVLGSVDIGGSRASLAMQLAETLGIDGDDVKPHVVDTDSIGFTGVTGGSRTTFAGGWACYEAAMDIRRQLEERASQIWEVDRDSVSYGDDGVIRGPADAPEPHVPRAGRPAPGDRRPDPGPGGRLAAHVGTGVRRPHRRCRGRPRDRQGRRAPLHGGPGRRYGHPPLVRRGADAGRRLAGRRHGADRGVLLLRGRYDAELQPAGLPHADRTRPADDRDGPRRGAEPRSPVRCAWRR